MAVTKKTLTTSKSAAKPATTTAANLSSPVSAGKLMSASRKTASMAHVAAKKSIAPASRFTALRVGTAKSFIQ